MQFEQNLTREWTDSGTDGQDKAMIGLNQEQHCL